MVKNNFDLKNFLIENKLTECSIQRENVNDKLKGLFHNDDNYYTYDHLLPDGTGDDATKEQLDMLYKKALKDVEILKNQNIKSQIGKDDMGLPFVDLI